MGLNVSDEGHRQLGAIAGLAGLLFLVLLASFVRTVRQAGVVETNLPDETVGRAEAAPASTSVAGEQGVASSATVGAAAPGNPLPTSAGQSQSWTEYRDSEHGISFLVPDSWPKQDPGGAARSAMGSAANLVFEDSTTRARLAVSVWDSSQLASFSEWIDEVAGGHEPVDGRRPTNASIAGRDALVVWSPESPASPAVYSAFLSDGPRYFRVSYSAADGGAGLSTFVRLLVSLSVDGEESLDTIPPLPMPDGEYFPSR